MRPRTLPQQVPFLIQNECRLLDEVFGRVMPSMAWLFRNHWNSKIPVRLSQITLFGNNASIKEKRSGFFLIAFYFLFVTLDPTQKI
jgi:hypothetical protein